MRLIRDYLNENCDVGLTGDINGFRVVALARFRAGKMGRVDDIKKQVSEVHRKRKNQHKHHSEIMGKLKAKLKNIQENCPHFSRTFHESRGVNRHTTCDQCGKLVYGNPEDF